MFIALILATALTPAPVSNGVSMKFIPSGATRRVGGYRPVPAKFSATRPADVKHLPPGLKDPKYGVMGFGKRTIGFIIDDSVPSKIFVDSNGDGNYANDPKPKWGPMKYGDLTMFSGNATADLGKGQPCRINFYRFDPKDPRRPGLKNILLYYGDFGYEVTLNLGGKDYTSFVAGEPGPRTSLWVDRDGNGKRSFYHEMIQVGKPFNFTGTTYVLNAADGKLSLAKAAVSLPKNPMPPRLDVGDKVIPFTAPTMDGKKINFPGSYRGKIVMLDFWATWCGPCMGEVPNVVKAYKQFHGKGFDILGVSFDRADSAGRVRSVTKKMGMTWPQIYEGKYWNTSLGHKYDVAAIPFSLLVDGTTGKILSVGDAMRGERLAPAIEKALASHEKP